MFYMRDIGWGWEFLMGVGMVVFWAVVVFGIVWLIRGGIGTTPSETPTPPPPGESALDILDRRLASGELTVEEYQERREAIERAHGDVGASV